MITLPDAPNAIKKGQPLKHLLSKKTVVCLAHNIHCVYPEFDQSAFITDVMKQLEDYEFKQRGLHIAMVLHSHLPSKFEQAVQILIHSLTPENTETEGLGLAGLFYEPHSSFISLYGVYSRFNSGEDPFNAAMAAQYQLTKRYTAEFAIRPFLIQHQQRTLDKLKSWLTDDDPHVRRLCSEGTRPRLPWAARLPAFIADPSPALPILEQLKDDESLYVRRSVANHLGDIAKDHPNLVFDICHRWLQDADKQRKWLIRHALRHPAKKQNPVALALRSAAK